MVHISSYPNQCQICKACHRTISADIHFSCYFQVCILLHQLQHVGQTELQKCVVYNFPTNYERTYTV